MFNNQALDALKSLKQEIRTAKNITKGTVRATPQKFGFIVDNDDQQHFVSPDTMESLLPDDQVEFYLKDTKSGDAQVVIEKLVKQSFKDFFGRVVMRGKHMFVEADAHRFSRWFFIPPNARSKAKDGDLVRCSVIKHPMRLEGKNQAKIRDIIGQPDNTDTLLNYQKLKHSLIDHWSEQHTEAATALKQLNDTQTERVDLRELPFITIDAEQTKDMDDALYVESTDEGFFVRVAIADPWSYLKHSKSLANAIISRAISSYFPANTLHMMPEGLSQELFSLLEGEERNAIVIAFNVSHEGKVSEPSVQLGLIKSAKKMSYNSVQSIIESADFGEYSALINCFRALAKYRREHHVILTDRPDYFFQFDENRALKSICRVDKQDAHRLVEEYMIATNALVSNWLIKHKTGLFVAHRGFRDERKNDLNKLLKEYFPELESAPTTPEEFAKFLNDALHCDADIPLRSVLTRWLAPATITVEYAQHLGLGFDSYTTMTSPIRKAVDLLNHRAIHEVLCGIEPTKINTSDVEKLNEGNRQSRLAVMSFETSMRNLFALKQLEQDQTFDATISQVSSAGLVVRLDDTGIEGFIDLRVKKGQENDLKFEGWRLCTTKAGQFYHVDQPLQVKFEKSKSNQQQLKFSLA